MLTEYEFALTNAALKKYGGRTISQVPLPYNIGLQRSRLDAVANTPDPSVVPMPTITPSEAPHVDPVTITMACADLVASIYWTNDGSEPTAAKTLYTVPFALTGSAAWTIKAVAINGARQSGINTLVATRADVATPTADTDTGNFNDNFNVTLSCATAGATIRYTTDGVTTPTASVGTIYAAPVAISATTTLKFIAYKTNYTNSAVVTKVYTKISYGYYWGASTSATLTDTDIMALTGQGAGSITTGVKSLSFDANSPEAYLYIVIPSADLAYMPDPPSMLSIDGVGILDDLASTGSYTDSTQGWPHATVTVLGRTFAVFRTLNKIADATEIDVNLVSP